MKMTLRICLRRAADTGEEEGDMVMRLKGNIYYFTVVVASLRKGMIYEDAIERTHIPKVI